MLINKFDKLQFVAIAFILSKVDKLKFVVQLSIREPK